MAEAIPLKKRPEAELVAPPVDEKEWFGEREQARGVDFSKYE